MTEKNRALIEKILPIVKISEEAKKEKNGRAPTFEMHYWWTRKPLVTARAAVLGALLPENYPIEEFERLLGLSTTDKRAHNYDINLDHIELLRKEYFKVWGTENPVVLDPFAGGGSIPFEAMRIGVDVISNDYNPAAHLIQKATLEYPRRYGQKLYKDVEKGLDWIFEETKKQMEEYYPPHDGKDVMAYLWSWMVECPNCGFDNPLVGQWWLVRRDKNNLFIDPSIEGNELVLQIKKGKEAPEGTCSRAKGKCLFCGNIIQNDVVRKDIYERGNEKLLAVILKKNKGKDYDLPSDLDESIFIKVNNEVRNNFEGWTFENLIPLEEMPKTNDVRTQQYLVHWYKYLNPRQLLLFITLLKNIKIYVKSIENPDYAKAIATYLALIFGKHIDRNCRSATWDRTHEKISHALVSRGIGMSWDHTEVNPFVNGSGSLTNINKAILDGLKYSIDKLSNRGNIHLIEDSVTRLDARVELIVTDPPYFDDIQYAELSGFLYQWEQKACEEFEDFGDIPALEDMSVGGNRDKKYFMRLFKLACQKMHGTLMDNGLLVMFFAHSSVDAWDFVVNSLQKAGFRITATWPIHTENPTNPLARGNASIMSSIIIVARKRKSEKSGFIEEIQEDLEEHLKKRLNEFWSYGLRGADITVSAMGATLDIITQYSEIKSYTGKMTIKDVLELVQKYVSEYVLSRYIDNSSGLDGQTSFYLYTRLSGLDGMPFDTANLISKCLNVDLKQFENNGLIESSSKGKSKGVKLLKYNEREINGKKSLIDVVQYIMFAFAKSGYSEVQKEMDETPFSREEINNVLEAMLALPAEDPERQMAQRILEKMGSVFPKDGGQRSIVDDY